MTDIQTNLLKNRYTLSEKDYQRERSFFKLSIIGTVVVTVVVIALSAWNLVLTSRLTGIDKSFTNSSKEMQGLVQASAQQVYLKSRLKLITSFLTNRTQARESLQKIFSTSISGTHISGVSFEDEVSIAVQYTSDSSFALNQLITYYQVDTGYFTQAVTRGITRSKDGSYQMSILLTLPKETK